MQVSIRRKFTATLIAASAWTASAMALASDDESMWTDASSPGAPIAAKQENIAASEKRKKPKLDRSGKPQTGKASFYGRKFYGKKMADGTRMDPNSNVAASRTLPFGTLARVTNLENGKSAVVEIRDRGPFVPGRILDVSPSTAERLDMKADGVAPVRVTPIELPDVKGVTKTASAN